MTVYVDAPLATTATQRWPYTAACHMSADTPAELDAMARALNLRPEWLQDEGTCSEHYDVTPRKRTQAIRMGAKEITHRDAARMRRECRERVAHNG